MLAFQSLLIGIGNGKRLKKFMKIKSLIPLSMKRALAWFYARYIKPLPSYCRLSDKSGVNRIAREKRVVVSLTSYPARMNAIAPTLVSLLNQEFKPDQLVLWLAVEQFPQREESLPDEVLRLTSYGLEIRWTKDVRSYKKLIPTLKTFPEDIIVTCDDDTFYPPDWLRRLWLSYKQYPDCIHCHRGHTIRIDSNGMVLPFLKWEYESTRREASYRNFVTGIGGVLYPPHSLDSRVDEESLFMTLAPTCDDHWFWAMAVLNGRRIKLVDDGMRRCLVNPRSSTAMSLCKINTGSDFASNDDSVFRRLCEKFPILKERICQ